MQERGGQDARLFCRASVKRCCGEPRKVLTREDFAARREAAENAKKARRPLPTHRAMHCLHYLRQARLQSAPKAGAKQRRMCCSAPERTALIGAGKCAEKADGLPSSSTPCMSGGRRNRSTEHVLQVMPVPPARSWCAAVSSAPSSSSAIKIIVDRTRRQEWNEWTNSACGVVRRSLDT